MRVTNIMLTNSLLNNLRSGLSRLQECQDRLASGKEIRRPSDDPVRVTDSLSLRSDLGEIDLYTNNVQDAKTWMEVTDSALASATEVLQKAGEIAVEGSNDTLPQESRQALAQEVNQLVDQLKQIANTNLGGRYIFGGTQTTDSPVGNNFKVNNDYTTTGWVGNENDIKYEIAPKVTVTVNIPGKSLFDGDKGAIAVLQKLHDNLYPDDPTKVVKGSDISQSIGEIEQIKDKFITTRGELGARINRLEMTANRLQQDQVQQTGLLSQAEDTDVARAIIDLKSQENAYRVTLAAGARIILPTLIDFLR